jgi:hypothetical protein
MLLLAALGVAFMMQAQIGRFDRHAIRLIRTMREARFPSGF